MYRVVKFKRPNGVLDGITFKEITSIRTIGATKARGIADALVKIGVEVKDIPEIVVPTRLVAFDDELVMCTNCHARFHEAFTVDAVIGIPFKFCPVCGKKIIYILED